MFILVRKILEGLGEKTGKRAWAL